MLIFGYGGFRESEKLHKVVRKFNARIALDVKNAIGNEQIVIEFLCAANVQDRIGVAIELPDSRQGEPGRWITW